MFICPILLLGITILYYRGVLAVKAVGEILAIARTFEP